MGILVFNKYRVLSCVCPASAGCHLDLGPHLWAAKNAPGLWLLAAAAGCGSQPMGGCGSSGWDVVGRGHLAALVALALRPGHVPAL